MNHFLIRKILIQAGIISFEYVDRVSGYGEGDTFCAGLFVDDECPGLGPGPHTFGSMRTPRISSFDMVAG